MDGNPLSLPYQSIGSVAVNAFVGRSMGELYPSDRPHFLRDMTPEALFDPTVPPDVKAAFREQLAADGQVVMLTLEQAGNGNNGPSGSGFYAVKQRSLAQLAVTGNTCERLNGDFSLTLFRLDSFVVQRDGEGRVVRVITREDVDPMSLSDAMLAKAGVSRDELRQKSASDRKKALYTSCHWDYTKRQWHVCQQIDAKEIYEADRKYSPYAVAAIGLAPGDSYGRGLIEMVYGDLYSYDKLCQCMLDYAGMSSKLVPCIDENSNTRAEDLAKPSGVPIFTKVRDGQTPELAFLQVNKGGDMSVVQTSMQVIAERLGKALMLLSESVRNSERTTAYEVSAVTIQQQQESMLSVYASIADQLDGPQIEAAIEQCMEKKKIQRYPADVQKGVRTVLLTGQTALAAQARVGRMLALAQLETQIGEQPGTFIDRGVLYRAIARMQRVDEPGLVKSAEQVASEREAAIQQQLQLAAGQQAIASSGAIAEQAAASAMQPKG